MMIGLSTARLAAQLDALRALEAMLTFPVARLGKLLDAQGGRLLAGSGLNLTNYRILLVARIFGEISVSDLSRVTVVDRAQISRAAAELRGAGLIEMRGDPTSKRRKLISVTPKGEALLDEVRPLFEARQARLEAQLTPEELSGFRSVVSRLSGHLAEELNQPEAMPVDLARK